MTTNTNDTKRTTWRNLNPLRKWRDKSGVLRADVAASLGVALGTIANIETGATPLTDYTASLVAKLMKVDPTDLKKQWDAWIAKAPKIGG